MRRSCGSEPLGHIQSVAHSRCDRCCNERQPSGARRAGNEVGARQGAALAGFCRAKFVSAAAAHCQDVPLAVEHTSPHEGFDAQVVKERRSAQCGPAFFHVAGSARGMAFALDLK